MEAILGGFHEGIVMNHDGYVSEGSGENIFIVRGRDRITPPLEAVRKFFKGATLLGASPV